MHHCYKENYFCLTFVQICRRAYEYTELTEDLQDVMKFLVDAVSLEV